mgnify:CR=1 FL=1
MSSCTNKNSLCMAHAGVAVRILIVDTTPAEGGDNMCEATAYMIYSDKAEEMIMESVTKIAVDGGRLIIDDLFGQRKEIEGSIKEINLVKNRIEIKK